MGYNYGLFGEFIMLEPHLLNLIEQNKYQHVTLWCVTPDESVRLVIKATKVLKNFTTKVAILTCPSEPSEYTGYIGMRVQFLALPDVVEEVKSIMEHLSF